MLGTITQPAETSAPYRADLLASGEIAAKPLAALAGTGDSMQVPTAADIAAMFAAVARKELGRDITDAQRKAVEHTLDALAHEQAAAKALIAAGSSAASALSDGAAGLGSTLQGSGKVVAGGIVYGASAPVDVLTHGVLWPVGQGLQGLGWLLQRAGEGLSDTTEAGSAMRAAADDLFSMSRADFDTAWGYYAQSYAHAQAAGEYVGDSMVETARMLDSFARAGYHVASIGVLAPAYATAAAAQLSFELADLGLGAAANVISVANLVFVEAVVAAGNGAAALSGSGKHGSVQLTAPQPLQLFNDIVDRLKREYPNDAGEIDAIVRRRWPMLMPSQPPVGSTKR